MAPDSSPFPTDPSVPPEHQPPRRDVGGWRKRSEAIRFWRRALPVTIASIVGLLVLWIAGRSIIVKLTAPSGAKNTGVHMVNPRFYGRDSSNRAFVLGATEAARDMTTGKSVTLSGPSVTLDAESSSPTHVQADHGVYREDQRRLTLEGKVQMKSSGGYNFQTPRAVVDTSSGTVSGNSGVQGEGPLGHVVASSYGVYDRGRRIVMKGDVHAHIVQ
jgi:lipopolysaccharide export system protein LptC